MVKLPHQLTNIFTELQKQYPHTNLKNVVTGLLVLVIFSIFSVGYFSRTPSEAELFQQLTEQSSPDSKLPSLGETELGKPNPAAATYTNTETEEFTEVLPKEGLWHVAKRVCGDGESYNHLAAANKLNVRRAKLYVGQRLKVDCGNK